MKRRVEAYAPGNRPLSDTEHAFCEQYVFDLKPKAAAIRAGWPERSAASAANKLLKRPAIQARIRDLQAQRSARCEVNSDYVLQKTKEVLERTLAEIKPALHPVTRRQLKDDAGNPLFTYNAAAALRALELLGKHVDVGAFEDRVKVGADASLI